jgi:hypothetical protein
MKGRDVTEDTKIKSSRNHNIPNSDLRKREVDGAKKRNEKICLCAMDVEKNFMSSVDREENKIISFGGNETHKITRSNNPPIKGTLFWSRYDNKRVTGTGHYAWRSCRLQEAWKTTDVLA